MAMNASKVAKAVAGAVRFRWLPPQIARGAMITQCFLAAACCREKVPEPPPAQANQHDQHHDQHHDQKADVELSPRALTAAELRLGQPKRVARRTAVTAAGTLDFVPKRVARIGPQIAGRVASIAVVPGQIVSRGTTLVVLDSVDVGRARADYLEARSRLELAAAEVAREERLVDAGASSERALFAARTDQRVAEVDLKSNAERLRVLGAGTQIQGGPGAGLVAPIAGKVLEIRARVGQPVGPTDTLVVVGATSELWLVVDLYERDLGKVHLGDDVLISAVAFPDRSFRGKVDQLGAVVDPTRRVLEGRIVLENPDDALKPGMTATARILGAADPNQTTIAVPRGALQNIDGQPFVFVEQGPGKFEMRAVERGGDLEDGVEILRGLQGTETLAVEGTFILKSEVLREQMGAND